MNPAPVQLHAAKTPHLGSPALAGGRDGAPGWIQS